MALILVMADQIAMLIDLAHVLHVTSQRVYHTWHRPHYISSHRQSLSLLLTVSIFQPQTERHTGYSSEPSTRASPTDVWQDHGQLRRRVPSQAAKPAQAASPAVPADRLPSLALERGDSAPIAPRLLAHFPRAHRSTGGGGGQVPGGPAGGPGEEAHHLQDVAAPGGTLLLRSSPHESLVRARVELRYMYVYIWWFLSIFILICFLCWNHRLDLKIVVRLQSYS